MRTATISRKRAFELLNRSTSNEDALVEQGFPASHHVCFQGGHSAAEIKEWNSHCASS
jgi:hypothetical protein